MILNCLLVDDEPLALRVLEKYCKDILSLNPIASCTDAFEAIELLEKELIDLLFLDIDMPDLNGMALLKALKKPPMTIITTAYPEFAVESFDLDVLDYLLKPIQLDRFLKAVNKAIQQKQINQALSKITKAPEHTISIKADRKLFRIKTSDINYIQAYGDYVKVFTKTQMLVPKETLNQIQARLPLQDFVRVHRSYLVAYNAINYIEGNFISLEGAKIPIGQTYKADLIQKMKNF